MGAHVEERIESENHRREIAAAVLSAVLDDWYELERSTQREAVDEWLAEHPEVTVGATVDRAALIRG